MGFPAYLECFLMFDCAVMLVEFGGHGKRQQWLWFNGTTVTDIITGVHYLTSATV